MIVSDPTLDATCHRNGGNQAAEADGVTTRLTKHLPTHMLPDTSTTAFGQRAIATRRKPGTLGRSRTCSCYGQESLVNEPRHTPLSPSGSPRLPVSAPDIPLAPGFDRSPICANSTKLFPRLSERGRGLPHRLTLPDAGRRPSTPSRNGGILFRTQSGAGPRLEVSGRNLPP